LEFDVMLKHGIMAAVILSAGAMFYAECALAYDGKSLSAAYNDCIEKADGVTSNMHDCMDTEIKVQDKRLNLNYGKFADTLNPERRKKLVELQRLWIKYRDQKCEFLYDPDGGTFAGIVGHSCFLEMTAERADELEIKTY